MKSLFEVLAVASLSALQPAFALAQDYAPPSGPVPGAPLVESTPAPGPGLPASDWEEQYDQAPATSAAPSTAPGVPAGEWVQTEQYGWVWMPYADSYTRVPPDGYGEPYTYLYYPAYGWCWVVAPWVWGLGPWPTFGFYGAVHFGWYGHGWWRTPHRWHWTGSPGFRGGFAPVRGWRGGAPAPGRPGLGTVPGRGGPAFRGGGMRTGGPAYQGGFGRRSAAPGFTGGSFHGGLGGRGPFAGGGGGAFHGGHAGSGAGLARAFGGGGHRSFGR